MISRIVPILIIILSCYVLSSCSLFKPVEPTPINTYLLSQQNTISTYFKSANSQTTILIAVPSAPSWLDSSNMVYQQHQMQLNNFSKNQWADSPAHMLQPLVIQALTQTNHYQAVIPAPYVGVYDQRLDLNILDFKQDFTQLPSCFRLRVQAQLVNSDTQRVIRSTVINEVVTAPVNSPAGGVVAANKAVSIFLQQLVRFCVSSPLGGWVNSKSTI